MLFGRPFDMGAALRSAKRSIFDWNFPLPSTHPLFVHVRIVSMVCTSIGPFTSVRYAALRRRGQALPFACLETIAESDEVGTRPYNSKRRRWPRDFEIQLAYGLQPRTIINRLELQHVG
jgi:hypothetical protein